MLGRGRVALGLFLQHHERLAEARDTVEAGLAILDAAHPDAVAGRSHHVAKIRPPTVPPSVGRYGASHITCLPHFRWWCSVLDNSTWNETTGAPTFATCASVTMCVVHDELDSAGTTDPVRWTRTASSPRLATRCYSGFHDIRTVKFTSAVPFAFKAPSDVLFRPSAANIGVWKEVFWFQHPLRM